MRIRIDGKTLEEIEYIQITYGKLIDFRKYDKHDNETIVYSTKISDKMIFIDNEND